MSTNLCQHTHPDGTGCQAPAQTGRSFCFFHDPKQERNRARAQRNGGFMRGRYIDSQPEPSAMAALNLAPIEVEKVDDVIPIIVEHLNLYRQGKITKDDAQVIFKGCNGAVCAFREKRQAEHEARLAAEAAREAQKKDAERQIAGFNSQSRFSGTDENSPPFQRREKVEDEQFHSAEGQRGAERSATKAQPEAPVIIDASQPWDPRQFGGKKPRISCVVPVFTSMRTGKIIDVNEPSPLDPPEHMLREEFRRKPQPPSALASAEVAQCDATKAAEKSRECGTNENSPPFQRREGEIAEEEPLAAAGTRGAEQSATKKEPLYSITSLLIEPPRPFESKPRDPCTDPPETPPPPKPPAKPGLRLHPMLEYWGLH